MVGRLDGVGLYPDVYAGTDGLRRVLVYVKDGRRDDLPGQVNWRLVVPLLKPNIMRPARYSGGKGREGKDAKGNVRSLPLLAKDMRISGLPEDACSHAATPWHFTNQFEGALQLAAGFPRTSYKGTWHVSKRGNRLMFRSTGLVLDKVH